MTSDALQQLDSRLSRLRSGHVGTLLAAGSTALESFDPKRKDTFAKSLESYVLAATSEQTAYCARVRQEVLSLTEELLLPLSEAAKAELLALTAKSFDESLYPQRLALQEEAMVRKAGRYGFRVDDWGVPTDIQRSLHHVGTSNHIRQALATLAEELELVRLRSARKASVLLSIPGEVHMPLTELLNDRIDILKTDGTKLEGISASVQRTKVFMNAANTLVEPNDLIIRRMSNGGEETYRVIDPGFHEAFHGIEAHYQMEVQKLGLPEAKSAVQSITYNISGNNARINQNSIDNSTNLVQVDARAMQQIQLLRQELQQAQLPAAENQAASDIVDEIEEAFRSGKQKKSVVSALLKSLPHAANITSIVAAILSLL